MLNIGMIITMIFFGSFFIKNGPINVIIVILCLGAYGQHAYSMAEKNVGAEGLEHEDGVSLRQDSNTVGTRSLFIYYNNRSHMGGGLAGGK